MIFNNANVSGYKYTRYIILLLLCILLTVAFAEVGSCASSKDYLPPGYGYTSNFYQAYGEPDIHATVLGDTEFRRGETVNLQVVLSNRGVLHGFKPVKDAGKSSGMQEMALRELQHESLRTTAFGVKATLVSPTDMIEVDPKMDSHTIEMLAPGVLLDDPLLFTIKISNNIPAGMYILDLPLMYEYRKDVRMTGGRTIALGLPELDHAVYYESIETTLQIPVFVKPQAKFEVTDISGFLVSGDTGTVDITYTNVGEIAAQDAIARVIVMKPLSVERSTRSLGKMQPGESKTASFNIGSDRDAVEKIYVVNSEIRYLDERMEYAFSDNMKANVNLIPPERKLNITGLALAGIVFVLTVLIIKNRRNKDQK